MQFIDLANQVIPGYELLSEDERNTFQMTASGQRFVNVVSAILESVNAFNESFSLVSILWGSHEKQRELKKSEWQAMKAGLINEIGESQEYQQLITAIITKILENKYPDFAVLPPQMKTKLAKAEFSKILQADLLPIEIQIRNERSEIDPLVSLQNQNPRLDHLQEQYDAVFRQWMNAFQSDLEMADLREQIAIFRGRERVKTLTSRLAILSAPISLEEPLPAIEFIHKYGEESHKQEPDYDKMEDEFLTGFLCRYLQRATDNHLRFINLDNFNLHQANSIAKKLLEAANTDRAAEMNAWLDDYRKNLSQFIHKQLLLINGHEWQKKNQVEDDSDMQNSLSYLFWHSKAVNKTSEFLNKVADAHAFIQYTGMSTQNESSYLVLVDLYNYYRSAEQITETRTILFSLAEPFMPLYQEFKEIGLYEKSVFRKVLRTVLPLIVIAAFVVLVGAILAPLGLPELAFLVAAIPALLIGVYLASKYVTLKNELHQYIRNEYYGGPFEIPEFKINRRMEQIFGSKENAEIIRGIYIDELKICDELEKGYSEAAKEGLLSGQELEFRKNNLKQRYRILTEWYDIHSNNELGYEKVPQIVQNRFNELVNEEVSSLQKNLEEHDLAQINVCVGRVVDEIKTALVGPRSDNTINSVSPAQADVVPQQGVAELKEVIVHSPGHNAAVPLQENSELQREERAGDAEVRSRVSSLASGDNIVRFFRPRSIVHQDKAAKLERALNIITAKVEEPPRTREFGITLL